MVVSGVITQGRYAGGQGEEYAEQVTLQVSLISVISHYIKLVPIILII